MQNQGIKLNKVSCPFCRGYSNAVIASGRDYEYATCNFKFVLYKCGNCDLIYLSPRPDITELSRIYPTQYNPFHFHEIKNPIVRWGRNFVQKKKASIIKKLVPKAAKIIDVGCGSGTLLMFLKKYGSKKWRLFGNDFNLEPLKRLKKLEIEMIPGRFEEINTNVRFDLIVLNQTIEHLDCPDKVIKKATELLISKGLLLIETPSIDGLDAKIFQSNYWGGYHIPRHWTIFSSASITKLLKEYGFQNINISYLTSPSFWIQSFHHFFLDKNYPEWWVNCWVFRNILLLGFFTIFDIVRIIMGRPTSNMRVVAQKL